jgi:protein-S-isoprenylcysteine O-methyltransferase Ste14
VLLKPLWGRPRPAAVTEFGGQIDFTAWWDPLGQCDGNCSFVCGEESLALWFVAWTVVLPARYRSVAMAGALFHCRLIALIRIATGAHFFSDVLFAVIVTALSIWVMYWVAFRLDIPKTLVRVAEDPVISPVAVRNLYLLLAAGTIGMLLVFGASRWSERIQEMIEWTGLALIFICIGGRCWCALGGCEGGEPGMAGPYSIARNPLYLFSTIGAVGVGAQFGGVSVAILAGLLAAIIHVLVVRQEEGLLLARHGDIYRQYVDEVPRFLPGLFRWKDVNVLEVRPRAMVMTLIDACFLLVSIPIAESLEYFQQFGYLHVFLRLP